MDLDKLNKLLLDYSFDEGRIIWGEVFHLSRIMNWSMLCFIRAGSAQENKYLQMLMS
ncbi:hypothetical protein OIN60_15940 [Paenibacillus sp. P96]|uniref:Uncharacterized protein n=1 Tax=Paenibacillus zeirhizosphaerae TaxID=2987519 RepID=A0ABT9FU41_9BACL|nr:hypothetical protein [Paenibacillus sp. P96]MDP4098249.1 hypothetical protein [Paenibacillus sp. P96]